MSSTAFEQKIEVLIKSRAQLIVIESVEERRLEDSLSSVCKKMGRALISWDVAEAFSVLVGKASPPSGAKDPLVCLDYLEAGDSADVFWLKDFEFWNNPQIKRKLRSVVQRLKYSQKTVLVSCPPVADVPKELKDEAEVVQFPPPSAADLNKILGELLPSGVKITLNPAGRDQLIQAAQGLTLSEAERIFGEAITLFGAIDERAINLVLQEKKHVVAQSGALQFVDASQVPNDVGGLGALKQWVLQRQRANTPEARAFGLPAPKGILLMGIPGTGKSLAAKKISHLWNVPLLRLNVGALFDSLVGESEANIRRALSLAEWMAPLVLWIDEIDKAFSQGDHDGGTSKRVFGDVLTWMAEKTAPCFVVATANDISRLPLELLRKGRFDEVFFLDLPTSAERKQIFDVHLKQRRCDPRAFDLDQLVRASEDYVGSEIEGAVVAALHVAFYEGSRKLTTSDVLVALSSQVPLSVSHRETITQLRQWLKEGRARSASFAESATARNKSVPIVTTVTSAFPEAANQPNGHPSQNGTDDSDPPAASSTPIDIRPKGPTPKRPRNSTGGPP